MTDPMTYQAANSNVPDDWTALKTWFEENVFDDTPLPPTFIAQMEAEVEVAKLGQLDESAVLYKWCPTRKRLVPSH
jgi:hypothetical protein